MPPRKRSRGRRPVPRRVTREVPLWQRHRKTRQVPGWQGDGGPVVQLSGRHAAQIATAAAQAAAVAAAQAGWQTAAQQGAPAGVDARTWKPVRAPKRAWRFRRHVQPFIWLVLLLAAGAGLHAAPDAFWWGLLASVLVPAAMLLATGQRHRDKTWIFSQWVRRFIGAQAVATSFWLNMLGWLGVRVCGVFVLASAAPMLGLWVRHYRWRPGPAPAVVAPVTPDQDLTTFAALAQVQKWNATLGDRQDLGGGSRKYPIKCDGIRTSISKVLGPAENVAAAWDKPMTECYVERDPSQIPSRGLLTILNGNSLTEGRFWDGKGMDLGTGLVKVGRFADGEDAFEQWYREKYGCDHELVSGTTGSGKSSKLDLSVFVALQTGLFVPVILDPQEGQSLPFWRERCIYASGVGEVEQRLRGLYAGFMDRSAMLGTTRWVNHTKAGPVEMPGMPFFDHLMTGLKMVLVILDEAHLVLKDGDKHQRQIVLYVTEMARLIRKAGGRMILATQLPGLKELGGEQALRDMLRGGTVWSGRTANTVSSGQLGLTKDPSLIPRKFPDGTKTSGLGYMDGWSGRPDAPMRLDLPAPEAYANPPAVPVLDDRFLEVMDRAMWQSVSPTSTVAPVTGEPSSGGGALLTLVRPAEAVEAEDVPDDAPEGKRCADAVWKILADDGGALSRGVIIERAGVLADEWGRPKPWSIKAIQNVLGKLADGQVAGRAVTKSGNGVYRANR